MSSEQDRARELAERIARRLADASHEQSNGTGGAQSVARNLAGGADLEALSATLSEIQRRLAHIESHISHEGDCEHGERRVEASPRRSGASPETAQRRQSNQKKDETGARPAWLSGTYVPAVSHPSQERFADIGEAVTELVELFEQEKTCSIEPGGKPCDHCGMCSSRGF
jgi:hypothetical protein